MCAGGLTRHDSDGYRTVIVDEVDPLHAVRVFEFAKAMLQVSRPCVAPGCVR